MDNIELALNLLVMELWHNGHRWLIDQRLNEGKNVLICVREVSKDDKN